MKIILYSIALISLLSTSCVKKQYSKIEGSIINYGDRKPIASAKVYIQEGISTSGQILDDPNSKGSGYVFAYTDSLGKFSIEIECEQQPFFGWGKQGYFYSPGTTIYALPSGVLQNKIFELHAESTYAPILFSKNATINDTVYFERLYNRYIVNKEMQITGNEYLPITNQPYDYYKKGPFEIFSSGFTVTGDMYQPYRITLKRNGTTKEILDSVYIKAFETFKDTLYY